MHPNVSQIESYLKSIPDGEYANAVRQIREVLERENDRRLPRLCQAYRRGDRVEFEGRGGRLMCGLVTGTNQKTVSVDADDGQQWRVSPVSLRRSNAPVPERQIEFRPAPAQIEYGPAPGSTPTGAAGVDAFTIGEIVDLKTPAGPIRCRVLSINRKTVSVAPVDGSRRGWRASPQLLTKARQGPATPDE